MALDRDQDQRADDASTAGSPDLPLLRLLDPSPEADARDRAAGPISGARVFLDALGVALYTTDDDGRITFYNEAAAALWGRRPQAGERWCGSLHLFWPDGRPMAHEESPIARAMREDRPVRGATAHAERPDGSRVSFETYPTPLHDRDGRLVGAVNVLVDITERLAAEDFLGLVSHELRTPVTTIYGNAQLLLHRSRDLPDEPRDMLADIAEDSDRLLGVIENLLLLTRAEAGTPPELEPQLLDHVLRRACEAFQKRRGRAVSFTRMPGSHVVVEADWTYLELVVGNLLSNADKYSPRSQPIDVVLSADRAEARVSVLDRGIGIGESEAERIFTPFYRSASAKRQASGMGIGLAVCKRILEAQGGRVWARPRPDGGAEVGFALPLMDDPGD